MKRTIVAGSSILLSAFFLITVGSATEPTGTQLAASTQADCVNLTDIQLNWTRKEDLAENTPVSGLLSDECLRVAVLDSTGAVIRGGRLQ